MTGVRRRADLVFPTGKIAVYVDGCFWHRCPLHGTRPKNNAEWWAEKLARNVARDRDTDRQLAGAGWTVLRFWEHEPVDIAADTVEQTVRRPHQSNQHGLLATCLKPSRGLVISSSV